MNKHNTTQGYILVLTLMIISLSVVLVTYLANQGTIYVPYARTVIDREKATLLALSGIQVALSELAVKPEPKKNEAQPAEQKKGAPEKEDGSKELLTFLLSVKNRWQTFDLKKQRDGIDGRLQICIMSEEGKIDINAIYDFKKQKFIGEGDPKQDYKKMLQELFARIEKNVKGKELFQAFEKFLKERQYRVNDVTELLTLKEFEPFKRSVVYEPSAQEKQQAQKKEQRPIYLTDIFTTYSGKRTLEPWLLADSVAAILELKRTANDDKDDKERVSELVKKFKRTASWSTDWNGTLSVLYGKEFVTLPQGIEAMLSTTFEPKTFSVLCAATVGKVTQKLFVIIEREQSSSKSGEIEISSKIKKMYWL